MDMMEIGGIATAETRAGMRAQGTIDRGVSRSPTRVFDPDAAMTTVATASKGAVPVDRDRVEGQEADATPDAEVLLRCHSHAREKKETGRMTHCPDRFEAGLRALQEGVSKPRTRKTLTPIQRTIGPLRARRRPDGAHPGRAALYPHRHTGQREHAGGDPCVGGEPLRRLPAAESPASTACGRRVATGTRRPWDSHGKDRRDAHGCRIRRPFPHVRARSASDRSSGRTLTRTIGRMGLSSSR